MEAIISVAFGVIMPYILYIFILLLLTYLIWKVKQPLEIRKETPSLLKINHRIASDLPPIYPNGWNAVIESSHLSKNEIKPISMFGKDLVVFRGSSGKCYVFDAYCPHLGANLGIGGTIVGDSVRCPFHGWVFDQDGKCTHIPGIDCIKSMNAEIKKYDCIENNDFVYVWYHSRDEKPNWFPQNSELSDQKCYIYRGKATNIVYCHIQEINENPVDFQHLVFLHSAPDFLGNLMKRPRFYDTILKIIHFEWFFDDMISGTKFDENKQHLTLKLGVKLLGLTFISSKVRILLIGQTLQNWRTEIDFFGKRVIYMTVGIIQTNEMKNEIVHRLYSESGPINYFLSRWLIHGFCNMVERDSIIWSNKRFLSKPLLAKNEPKIAEYRRWHKQFY